MVIALLLPGVSGCALVRRGAGRALAPAAGNLAQSLERQEDLELVRTGAPAYLLLLDALAEAPTARTETLVAAADAYTAYALAFVAPEDRERAFAMFTKARDYGLRALAQRRDFRAVMDAPLVEFEAALPRLGMRDVPAMYSTAQAWSSMILHSGGSVRALADFPKALALMHRVAELDPGYRQGGPDLFFGVYYTVQPAGAGRDLERARKHFERAMREAGDGILMPRVLFAEFYARYRLDEDLFDETLQSVLAEEEPSPDAALMNAAARVRARSLMEQKEDLF